MSKSDKHTETQEPQVDLVLFRPLVKILLVAPLIFVIHVLEESPTFVDWFNAHVNPDIDEGMFWGVNIFGFVMTVVVCVYEWYAESTASLLSAIALFSLVMFANGTFHILSAAIENEYTPGVVTATLLYIPYYFVFMLKVVETKRISIPVLVSAAIIGCIPMAIHGYLILFMGSRLF